MNAYPFRVSGKPLSIFIIAYIQSLLHELLNNITSWVNPLKKQEVAFKLRLPLHFQ